MKCEGLKARHVVDVYDNYSEHPCEESSQVYLKSEADKVIAHHKYKRCLGIAAVCFEKSYSTTLVKYDEESGYQRNFYDWWGKRWLELAEKFKEA